MKLFVFGLVTLMSGCAVVPMTTGVIQPDGSCAEVETVGKRIVMVQSGVHVDITNNCSDYITVGGLNVVSGNQCLPFSKSTTVTAISEAFTGGTRYVSIRVKAFDRRGHYFGSATRRFRVNTGSGTRSGTYPTDWTVDRLDSPRRTDCPRR